MIYGWHAKDVTGSHVVLKQQSSKPFPQEVVEKSSPSRSFLFQKEIGQLKPRDCDT